MSQHRLVVNKPVLITVHPCCKDYYYEDYAEECKTCHNYIFSFGHWLFNWFFISSPIGS